MSSAIIGKLPGYNKNIDTINNDFEKNLLKGVTFIDMYPTSYESIFLTTNSFSSDGFFSEYVKKIYEEPGLFRRENKTSLKMFQSILKRLQSKYTYLGSNFAETEKIKIIAANDSTFTETFTNSYDNTNVIQNLYDKFKNSDTAKLTQRMVKGSSSMSHANMVEMVGNARVGVGEHSTELSNNWATLLQGAAYGMNLSTPQMWSNSTYDSSLTVFVKLVAPVGTQKCIENNILKPLMFLLAASSPITAGGTITGVPLLWEVQAQGVTNFRLGAINSISVIRGSFETTFNTDLQPTILDVRLSIVPLLKDFAFQSSTKRKSVYDQPEYLGSQNPGDIIRGTMNDNANFNADKIVSIKL